MDKADFMRRAIALCKEKMADGTGGYCASIIVRNGEIVGEGWNNVVEAHDPTGHCEINALRDAGRRLGTFDLSGCELYTTWEPCAMCAGAIWWARIDRVYFGNLLSDATRLGMDISGLDTEVATPSTERERPYERLLGEECFSMVKEWWDAHNPTVI